MPTGRSWIRRGARVGAIVGTDPAPEPVEVGADELAAAEANYRLLRKENEQLRDALGMARTEYGGKPMSELDEYDRLRLAANGFEAMDGVLRATIDWLRADLARALPVVEAAGAVVSEWEDSGLAFPRVRLAALLDALARAVRAAREQQMEDRP